MWTREINKRRGYPTALLASCGNSFCYDTRIVFLFRVLFIFILCRWMQLFLPSLKIILFGGEGPKESGFKTLFYPAAFCSHLKAVLPFRNPVMYPSLTSLTCAKNESSLQSRPPPFLLPRLIQGIAVPLETIWTRRKIYPVHGKNRS